MINCNYCGKPLPDGSAVAQLVCMYCGRIYASLATQVQGEWNAMVAERDQLRAEVERLTLMATGNEALREKLRVAELQLSEATRKGESLCQQNGHLLMTLQRVLNGEAKEDEIRKALGIE